MYFISTLKEPHHDVVSKNDASTRSAKAVFLDFDDVINFFEICFYENIFGTFWNVSIKFQILTILNIEISLFQFQCHQRL